MRILSLNALCSFLMLSPGKETKDQRNNRDQMIKGSKELKPKQAQRIYVGIGSPHEKSEFPERRCSYWWIVDISPRRRERGTSITQVGSAYLLYVLHINATGTYDITACGLDPHSRPTCLAVGPEQTDQTCGEKTSDQEETGHGRNHLSLLLFPLH